MLHARIAARAFNTPLLVEPSKAMAFLSGLGPRIIGRQVEMVDDNGTAYAPRSATLPSRAGVLASGLLEDWQRHGDAPYPVLDGIAVIEIAAERARERALGLDFRRPGSPAQGVQPAPAEGHDDTDATDDAEDRPRPDEDQP